MDDLFDTGVPQTFPRSWMGDDGVYRIDMGDIIEIDLPIIQRAYEQYKAIPSLGKVPVITYFKQGRGVHPSGLEAIKQRIKPEVMELNAIIVSSRLIRFLSDIYLPLIKPPCPFQFFVNEEAAMQWIRRKSNILCTKGCGDEVEV